MESPGSGPAVSPVRTGSEGAAARGGAPNKKGHPCGMAFFVAGLGEMIPQKGKSSSGTGAKPAAGAGGTGAAAMEVAAAAALGAAAPAWPA